MSTITLFGKDRDNFQAWIDRFLGAILDSATRRLLQTSALA